jgi:hypothetical protein
VHITASFTATPSERRLLSSAISFAISFVAYWEEGWFQRSTQRSPQKSVCFPDSEKRFVSPAVSPDAAEKCNFPR